MPIKKRDFKTAPLQTFAKKPKVTAVSEYDVPSLQLDTYVEGNRGNLPHPKQVPVEKLLAGVRHVQNSGKAGKMEAFYRDRIRSPLTAVRAFCVLCMDGARKANDCESVTCPLWAFRDGHNGFFGRFRESEVADAEADD